MFLNEEQQIKLNKKSVFISARENQSQFQQESFKSIQIPMVRFHWYVLKNCGYELDDFLGVPEFIDQKLRIKEEKNADALKLSGQLSLEIETEKTFQIRNVDKVDLGAIYVISLVIYNPSLKFYSFYKTVQCCSVGMGDLEDYSKSS